ncbi:MAG: PEP-CTERM sorting domain-containing protein [Phycisphaeraceae bacterium]
MIRTQTMILAASALAVTTLAPPQAHAWYVSMTYDPANIDHFQLRLADGYQFASSPVPDGFLGFSAEYPDPDNEGETKRDFEFDGFNWDVDFLNDKQNLLVAHGPNIDNGEGMLSFALYFDGDQFADPDDLPRFHFQGYSEGTLVSNHDFYLTGPDNTDAIRLDGTWQQSTPFETYDHANPAHAFSPGDADLDADIDVDDMIVWQNHYTGSGDFDKTWTEGDWNHDGAVDIDDAILWQNAYTGTWPGPAPLSSRDDVPAPTSLVATPEPGTAALVLTAGLGLALRRRRGK